MSTPDRPSLPGPRDEDSSRYARALLDASGLVPYERVDWEAFHSRLAARAELSLARLRHPRLVPVVSGRSVVAPARDLRIALAWWEYAARWSRIIVSASVAAGVVLIMVVRSSPKEVETMVASATAGPPYQVEGTRAVFESAALGRGSKWTIESAMLPSVADLLVPLGRRDPSR